MSIAQAGFRRRILIEPEVGSVTAQLEDDYHRMAVRLRHRHGVVTDVHCEMRRGPWTTCPGAMAQLEATFTGVRLEDFPMQGNKALNCTHLYDLGLFAAAHADDTTLVAYDILVTDEAQGRREARLWRGDELLLDWTLEGDRFGAPQALAGTRMKDLGSWIAAQDKAGAEAGRILRWASIIAQGRSMDIPAGLSASVFPSGTCYTFQPERAQASVRRAGAEIDFSLPGAQPLADHAATFRRGPITGR